jgi:hypothetical protein
LLSAGRGFSFPIVDVDNYRIGGSLLNLPVVAVDRQRARVVGIVRLNEFALLPIPMAGGSRSMLPIGELGRLANRRGLWATTDSGGLIVVAPQEGRPQFRVTSIGWTGDTLFSRLFDYDAIPIPQGVVDSLVSVQAHRARGISSEDAVPLIRQALGLITNYPPISRIVVGDEGDIWLAREERGATRLQWLVLNARGVPILDSTTPAGFVLFSASRKRLWGVSYDSNGVARIERMAPATQAPPK